MLPCTAHKMSYDPKCTGANELMSDRGERFVLRARVSKPQAVLWAVEGDETEDAVTPLNERLGRTSSSLRVRERSTPHTSPKITNILLAVLAPLLMLRFVQEDAAVKSISARLNSALR
jgi:hypothetical protein